MTFLSDEQNSVALFGIPKGCEPSWSEIALPAGRQVLPAWAKGLHVNWHDAYCNDPSFKIKTDRNLRKWDGKRFARDGDRFMAVSNDGRAEVYYQSGPLRLESIQKFKTLDGRLHTNRPYQDVRINDETGSYTPLQPGEFVHVERLCTKQEDGFGGAHIDLIMVDGTEVTLRGPWHGGCPPGFVEVTFNDMTSPYSRPYRKSDRRHWYEFGGAAGLFLTEELFLRTFATFQPHLRLVTVDVGRGPRLQALKPEWDEPKQWVLARARLARKQAEFDAMAPEDRPPYVACNFPKACGGKDHCAVAACNHCTQRKAA